MRALDRVVSVLETVAAEPYVAFPAQVARRVGLSLSTTTRLMQELAGVGLLERTPPAGGYRVGDRLVAIASGSGGRRDLLDAALPEMEMLRDLTGETLALHVRVGLQRVCVAEVQSRHQIRRVVPLGFTLPIHYGSAGPLFLADLPDDELEQVVATLNVDGSVDQELRQRIEVARERGWEYAANSWLDGLAGLSASVRDDAGPLAVMSVSGPSGRWTEAVARHHAPALLAAVDRISSRVRRGRGFAAGGRNEIRSGDLSEVADPGANPALVIDAVRTAPTADATP